MSEIVATTASRVAVRSGLWAESVVARVALAMIALHVVDDNFLQPEPGTAATGHLISGLVPLTLIVGAAACYGRLRPGFRAVLALVFGVLGVVAGTEAAYYKANGGASGDDYTGYLSAAAGLLLLGVGSITLWRSRRRDDGRPWRYVRRLLLTGAALVAVMFFLFPVSLAYVVTHTARAEVPRAELGPAYENVELHDERRPAPEGLVRPFEEPRGRDRLPWSLRPAKAGADACAPRLRRAALRSSRRGRERGRPECLRLGWRTGLGCRRRVPPLARPTSTTRGSGASASPSAARC